MRRDADALPVCPSSPTKDILTCTQQTDCNTYGEASDRLSGRPGDMPRHDLVENCKHVELVGGQFHWKICKIMVHNLCHQNLTGMEIPDEDIFWGLGLCLKLKPPRLAPQATLEMSAVPSGVVAESPNPLRCAAGTDCTQSVSGMPSHSRVIICCNVYTRRSCVCLPIAVSFAHPCSVEYDPL